jgi:hypothetical protein
LRKLARFQNADAEERQNNVSSGNTSRRGYGWKHQKLRNRWAREVARGEVDCARCGEPIWPEEPWDLGHVDGDKTRYSGPEHRACNRATATHNAKRRRRIQVAFVGEDFVFFMGEQRKTSRNW